MRGWHLTEFIDWTFMWKYTINMCRNDFDEDTNVMKQKKFYAKFDMQAKEMIYSCSGQVEFKFFSSWGMDDVIVRFASGDWGRWLSWLMGFGGACLNFMILSKSIWLNPKIQLITSKNHLRKISQHQKISKKFSSNYFSSLTQRKPFIATHFHSINMKEI